MSISVLLFSVRRCSVFLVSMLLLSMMLVVSMLLLVSLSLSLSLLLSTISLLVCCPCMLLLLLLSEWEWFNVEGHPSIPSAFPVPPPIVGGLREGALHDEGGSGRWATYGGGACHLDALQSALSAHAFYLDGGAGHERLLSVRFYEVR